MRLRTRTISCLVVLLAAAPAARAADPFPEVRQRAEAAREAIGAPALSIAVVLEDRLAWSDGLGLADVENEVPARAHTVYRIASISKPIGATAVMQLVERGKVSLDDEIQKYVPAFPRKGEHRITLRHILTHTSGIRHYLSDEEVLSTTRYPSVVDALRIFKDDPLLFSPGQRYSYSSYAYNLLGGVIEAASGLALEAYLSENVFRPAGMTSTYLERQGDIVKHRARQYVLEGRTVRNAPLADLSIKWVGGGIVSTVEDLARFHIALDQGKLLCRETLALMYEPGALADGTPLQYGLGWDVRRDDQGRRFIAHSGGATGGSSFLLRHPESGTAVALLCSVGNAGAALARLAREIATEVLLVRAPAGAPATR
jgi:CubicO group peptidase (beta-lactamase class C family)